MSKVNLSLLNRLSRTLTLLINQAEALPNTGETREDFVEKLAMASGVSSALTLESSAITSDIVAVLKRDGLQMQALTDMITSADLKDKTKDIFDSVTETTPVPETKTDKKLN